jgi:hypothetical protein
MAIQTIYTGDKKIDYAIANIYQLLNRLEENEKTINRIGIVIDGLISGDGILRLKPKLVMPSPEAGNILINALVGNENRLFVTFANGNVRSIDLGYLTRA